MVVGEFTASNIAMEEDAREEDKQKSVIDIEKLKADISANKVLAQQGKLTEALEAMLVLEKSARQGEDIAATKATCSAILEICFEAKKWSLLEENILLLSKRRSQLKQVIQAFVRQAITYVDQIPDKEIKMSLIKTLQTVTEGKIYVEIERARLTRKLAAMKEAEGNINEAAEILQEVPVETFGAMAKTEKIAFILEQVRLCLEKKDFIRAQILSKKISTRAFVERKGEGQGDIGIEGSTIEAADVGIPSLAELKLVYYQHMIRYYLHSLNYLEVTRCYKAMYESPLVAGEADKWKPILQKICWYIVLSPAYSTSVGSSSDVATLLASTLADKQLGDLPSYKTLLQTFVNQEIIPWGTFQAQYADEVKVQAGVFGGEDAAKRAADLKLRVIEHNLQVIAKYYTQIRTPRLAELLDLSADEAEKQLAELVVAKAIAAKVDRPAGLITFGSKQRPDQVLNSWSSNISKLLDLVEKSCQQIQKEAMIHKVQLKGMS